MIEPFGKTRMGQSVDRITLAGFGLTANIMTYGASIQDLRLEGHNAPLVLGFDTFVPYETHGRYFGAIVGRFANRIGAGQFEIDGVPHLLDRNFRDRHTLHGGSEGLGVQNWQIVDRSPTHVTLSIEDCSEAMGFPGTCHHSCTYQLEPNGTLAVELTSVTDKPTITSLAHHSYFMLDGSASCLDHCFQIEADAYLPVDEDLIPTGEIRPVAGTSFDFRTPRKAADAVIEGTIFDHNFCLSPQSREIAPVAKVWSPQSGVTLNVETTEPGLQFYAGHGLDVPIDGLNGQPYGPCAGFALETQIWPDAPNHANFPNAILRPGERRRQMTRYGFSL